MSVPFFGTTYAVAGTICVLLGLRKTHLRILSVLGALFFAVAVLNLYVENWASLKTLDFHSTTSLAAIGFLAAYTSLSLRLMQQAGVSSLRAAFFSSYLPVLYALAVGLTAAAGSMQSLENPPLVFYTFIVLICILHVPAFIAGKTQAMRARGQLQTSRQIGVMRSIGLLRWPLLALGAPLLITLIIQVTTRTDWRLFGINAVLSASILTIFAAAQTRTPDG
jgi:hypothetical protein